MLSKENKQLICSVGPGTARSVSCKHSSLLKGIHPWHELGFLVAMRC